MHRRFNRTQRNYIIIGLCAILVIMGVGYAAFQSQLRISGTSNIGSNFSVKILSITPNSIVGNAKDKPEVTTHTDTTATFGTTLESPGDSITYDVLIKNEGTIDAVLKTINKTDTSNSAILFETSGVNEGDELAVNAEATMKVKVTYNPAVTSQPTNLESNLKVTLDYAQAGTAVVPGTNNVYLGGQEVELVDSGDGLYSDEYEPGRLIYRGTNPNNYIEFNDELWRIVAKEADGTYKIIRNELLPQNEGYTTMAFDASNHRSSSNGNTYCDDPYYGCGVFAAVSGTFQNPSGSKRGTVTMNSSIQEYLNGTYYSSLSGTAKNQMTSHSFNIGAVDYLDESGSEADSLSKNITGEKMYTWSGNIGLANVSDVLKASLNPSCKSATDQFNQLNDSGTSTCNSNYLLDLPDSAGFWTINAFGSESGSRDGPSDSAHAWDAFVFEGMSGLASNNAYIGYLNGTRPVVFLKSDITLSGTGTSDDPYTIV